jgi:hypothetical protein
MQEYNKDYKLFEGYFPMDLRQSFIQYTRYLLNYFEVAPSVLDVTYLKDFKDFYFQSEFQEFTNEERDVQILNSIFNALAPFQEFIFKLDYNPERIFSEVIPTYNPKFLIQLNEEQIINIKFDKDDSIEVIESVQMLVL